MKVSTVASVLTAPALVAAAAPSLEYYRSVSCDAQSQDFFIERYTSPLSLTDDKLCHQTPVGTMAMKLLGDTGPECVVLAYDDYSCSNLVGSIPATGRCVAAMKARIGSWQAICNTTSTSQTDGTIQPTSFLPGELKRRGKLRLPAIRAESNYTADQSSTSSPCTTATSSSINNAATASILASELSLAISASASASAAVAATTSSPSAGAALSSAFTSGTAIAETANLTSYVTASAAASGNATYKSPSMVTATYTGKTAGNSTVTMQRGVGGKLSSSGAVAGVMVGLVGVLGIMVGL